MVAMYSNVITNKSSKCPEDGKSNFSISFVLENISMILSYIIFPHCETPELLRD